MPCQTESQDEPECIFNELQAHAPLRVKRSERRCEGIGGVELLNQFELGKDCDATADQAFTVFTGFFVQLRNRGNAMRFIDNASTGVFRWELPDRGVYKGWLGMIFPSGDGATLQSDLGNRVSAKYSDKTPRPWNDAAPSEDEETWYLSRLITGNDMNCVCEPGSLMHRFDKGRDLLTFACVEVPGLGACIETTSIQQRIDGSLSQIDADCGKDHGLQAIQAEVDSRNRWANFRFRCCQIAANPVRMTKFGEGTVPFYPDEQGIFVPTRRDAFNRPVYSSNGWQGTGVTPASLSYEEGKGEWCLENPGQQYCVSSDQINPLDQQLGGKYNSLASWQARKHHENSRLL